MTDRSTQLASAAALLIDAERTGTPCPPIRGVVDDAGVDDGYEVQRIVAGQMGRETRRIGRKIGLTARAVQEQMGVDQPDFGVLYEGFAYGDRDAIPAKLLIQPRAEVEVAFVLERDLPDRVVTTADIIRATDFVVAAIEVVDSRIADWDLSIFDTVADNASSGVFVLGNRPRGLRDVEDLGGLTMEMRVGAEIASRGTGAACLGHPVNAVTWLANTVSAKGAPLQAGEIVLSGALGPLVPVARGAELDARIDGLGAVRASIV